MSIIFANGADITEIHANGANCTEVWANGTLVWEKFTTITITQGPTYNGFGTLGQGSASPTAWRAVTLYSAFFGFSPSYFSFGVVGDHRGAFFISVQPQGAGALTRATAQVQDGEFFGGVTRWFWYVAKPAAWVGGGGNVTMILER